MQFGSIIHCPSPSIYYLHSNPWWACINIYCAKRGASNPVVSNPNASDASTSARSGPRQTKLQRNATRVSLGSSVMIVMGCQKRETRKYVQECKNARNACVPRMLFWSCGAQHGPPRSNARNNLDCLVCERPSTAQPVHPLSVQDLGKDALLLHALFHVAW